MIGIGALRENSPHRNIRESLLGSSGVGSYTGVSNRCTFVLDNQQIGSYALATELELIRFWPLPFGELVCHLITKMNDSIISSQITVFDPRMSNLRRFIPFLVYTLVYMSITSNLLNLATLSTWSDSVCTHTCYNFLRKPLLR